MSEKICSFDETINLLEEAELYVRGYKCEATPPRTKQQASELLKKLDLCKMWLKKKCNQEAQEWNKKVQQMFKDKIGNK